MSDSDRGQRGPTLGADLKFLCAVLLACVVGLGFGYLEGHQAERHQNSTYEYAEAAKRNAAIACADREPAAISDCIYDEINSSREASQAEQDLGAQQWMARWAALLTFFTLATTLISWMALRYLRDTFQQTAKGAQAAADATTAMVRQNEITEAAQRAWVTLAMEPRSVRRVSHGRLVFRLDFVATNIGQTAARNFELNTQALFRGQDENNDDFIDRIHRELNTWRSEYDSPEQATLVPKDTEVDPFEGEQNSKTLRWWGGAGWPVRATQPVFLAAAFYRTVSDPTVLHVSWRTWYLGSRSNTGMFRPLLFENDEVIEPPQLCASPFHTTLMHDEYPANGDTRHHTKG